jgi:hypothetical protein
MPICIVHRSRLGQAKKLRLQRQVGKKKLPLPSFSLSGLCRPLPFVSGRASRAASEGPPSARHPLLSLLLLCSSTTAALPCSFAPPRSGSCSPISMPSPPCHLRRGKARAVGKASPGARPVPCSSSAARGRPTRPRRLSAALACSSAGSVLEEELTADAGSPKLVSSARPPPPDHIPRRCGGAGRRCWSPLVLPLPSRATRCLRGERKCIFASPLSWEGTLHPLFH